MGRGEGGGAGTRRGSRTPNLLIRSQVLYPIELAAPREECSRASFGVRVNPGGVLLDGGEGTPDLLVGHAVAVGGEGEFVELGGLVVVLALVELAGVVVDEAEQVGGEAFRVVAGPGEEGAKVLAGDLAPPKEGGQLVAVHGPHRAHVGIVGGGGHGFVEEIDALAEPFHLAEEDRIAGAKDIGVAEEGAYAGVVGVGPLEFLEEVLGAADGVLIPADAFLMRLQGLPEAGLVLRVLAHQPGAGSGFDGLGGRRHREGEQAEEEGPTCREGPSVALPGRRHGERIGAGTPGRQVPTTSRKFLAGRMGAGIVWGSGWWGIQAANGC